MRRQGLTGDAQAEMMAVEDKAVRDSATALIRTECPATDRAVVASLDQLLLAKAEVWVSTSTFSVCIAGMGGRCCILT